MDGQPKHTPRYWWVAALVVTGAASVVAAAVGVTVGGVAAADPANCRNQTFDAPMQVVAMSPDGSHLVGIPTASDYEHNLLGVWHDGEYSEIALPAAETPYLLDVNDDGDVIGEATDGDTPWRLLDGEFQRLKAPDGSDDITLAGIGPDGTVVGSTLDDVAPKPVRWSPKSATATELDLDGHQHGEVADISEAGVIVGSVGDGTEGESTDDAWVWDPDGAGRQLLSIEHYPGKPGVPVAGHSEATAITGDWVLVSDAFRVKLDDPDKPLSIGLHPFALDDSGRAYGFKGEKLGAYDGKLIALPGLPDPPEPAEDDFDEESNTLIAVSADGGRIAGRTWDGDDVLWSCDGSTIPTTTRVGGHGAADGTDADAKACEVSALTDLPDSTRATTTDISADGSHAAVATGNADPGPSDAFGLWRDGEYTTVTGAPKVGNVDIFGVTDSGTVLGESSDPSAETDDKPWRYTDGEFELLQPPAGGSGPSVGAIAADGTVAGSYWDDNGGGPAVWGPGETKPRKLDTGGFGEGEATDVSDDGIVVGSRPERDDYALKAWMWDADGNGTPLPDLAVEEFDASTAVAIEGDWVLLYAEGDSSYTNYRYNIETKAEPEEVKLSQAEAIDAKGRVYGLSGSTPAVFDGSYTEQSALGDRSTGQPVEADKINAASADGSVFTGVSGDQPALWSCG